MSLCGTAQAQSVHGLRDTDGLYLEGRGQSDVAVRRNHFSGTMSTERRSATESLLARTVNIRRPS